MNWARFDRIHSARSVRLRVDTVQTDNIVRRALNILDPAAARVALSARARLAASIGRNKAYDFKRRIPGAPHPLPPNILRRALRRVALDKYS